MYRTISSLAFAVLLLNGALARAQGEIFANLPESNHSIGAASLPAGFYLENAVPGTTFQQPVAVAALPDGRLFVAEKAGVVHVVENGIRLATPFLDLQDEVLSQGDRGLLGFTIDPDFATNGRVYLYYAVDHDGTGDRDRFDAFGRVSSYTASVLDPNAANLLSRNVLVGETFATGIPACFYSHNGGTLAFGSDGTLLISTGDSASYNEVDAGGLYPNCFGPGRLDPSEDIGAFRTLRIQSLGGKILRIDPISGNGLSSNPFYTGDPTENASKVWAYGLRNPFRFGVRSNGSTNPNDGRPGSVYIGEVGWVTWEEQQVSTSGENFAWPCYEGPFPQPGYQVALPATNGCIEMPARTDPQAYWSHADPNQSNPPGQIGYSALGGAFYRGLVYPAEYRDAYFYGDFAFGWMAFAHVDADDNFLNHNLFGENLGFPVQITYDPYQEHLLLVEIGSGSVYRLGYNSPTSNESPVAVISATPTSGTAPFIVNFEGDASFDPEGLPLRYAWEFGDGNGSTLPNPTYFYEEPGLYLVTLTVTDPSNLTGSADITITAGSGSGAPQATIIRPDEAYAASPGDDVDLVALAYDPDQDASTLGYHWSVAQVHNGHEHPNFLESDEQSPTFTVPGHGVAGEAVHYRIYLTVTDDTGLTSSDELGLRVSSDEEFDVTNVGTPITLKSQLPGGNNQGIGVIHDGIFPPVGDESSLGQFDTFTDDAGGGRTEDWIGYEYSEPLLFSRVTFQEGRYFHDGGWFETLRVEVRSEGTWTEAQFLTSFSEYRGNDGATYNTYELQFRALEGDAIRIYGEPGGSARFISVGELRTFSLTEPSIAQGLPLGWIATDIGPVSAAGNTTVTGDTFIITGNGDLWGDTDSFQFACMTQQGDVSITARLDAVDASHPWAKVGLMIRSSLDTQSPYVMLAGTPENGQLVQFRPLAADTTSGLNATDHEGAIWFRLQREGDVFTGLISDNGTSWTVLGTITVVLGDSVLIGLAATSTDVNGNGDLAAGTFSNVSIGSVQPTDPNSFPDLEDLAIERVFPNPFNGSTTVRLKTTELGSYSIEVYDLLGRLVQKNITLSGGDETVDVPVELSGMASGPYLVRAVGPGFITTSTHRISLVR